MACKGCCQCLGQRAGMQVPAAHVVRLDVTPDVDTRAVSVTVLGTKAAAEGATAHVSVLDESGKEVSYRK